MCESKNDIERELGELRLKYEQEVKKNNNLLKMNSNLMRENDCYLNCFSMMKKWSHSFFRKLEDNEAHNDDDEEEESCIVDIEEEGEQFVTQLIQLIESKIEDFISQLETLKSTAIATPNNFTSSINKNKSYKEKLENEHKEEKECTDCQRWKEMYIKETKETTKLQKILDESAMFNTQKQLNFAKLKDDTLQLLESYLKMYRKELKINSVETLKEQNKEKAKCVDEEIVISNPSNLNIINHHNKETVRPKEKTKEKRSGSNSAHKNKKSTTINNNNNNNNHELISTKEPTPFSKEKTSRNNPKYTIELSPQKSSTSLIQEEKITNLNIFAQQSNELSKCLNDILSSYSELSKNLESENNQLKEQLKDLHEILNIYRERERNQILFK